MRIKSFLLSLLLITSFAATAQSYEFGFQFKKKNKKSVSFPFELVHNLIIIPIRVNNSDTMKFVLDTGVSNLIITDWSITDSIQFKIGRSLKMAGLGSDSTYLEALISYNNKIELPGIINKSHNIILMKEDIFHLSSGLGLKIHGIIGYDLIKDFIVEINYTHKVVKFTKPEYYKIRGKNTQIIPLEINTSKPYIKTTITLENGTKREVKLLVDTGASNVITLFLNHKQGIYLPQNNYYSYLGVGLNGDIFGYLGYINSIQIGKYYIKQPLVNYPDKGLGHLSVHNNNSINRSGSIGGEALKRFNITLDYMNNRMILKQGKHFNRPFSHNMSGLEISTPKPGYPIYKISNIRANSPAMIAGFKKNDRLLIINGIRVEEYSFNQIVAILQSRPKRRIKITVERLGNQYTNSFVLKDDLR